MKKTVFITVIAATAFGVAGGFAFAKGDRHGDPVSFETLDANADGQITLEEMQALRTARLASMDTDQDGFLSATELQAAHSKRAASRAERMIERLDADADGKLSMEELDKPGRGDRRFKRTDADGNGSISKAEFDTATAKMKKHHGDRDAE